MKQLLLLTLLCVSLQTFGQKLTGLVTDKSTGIPVSGAIVSLGPSRTITDDKGKFEISETGLNDTLHVSSFAYQAYTLPLNPAVSFVQIELAPKINPLDEVTIRAGRNFKRDSVRNRLLYTKQFNYAGPSLKDAFISSQVPGRAYGQMVTINPLTLISALTKKSTSAYRLQKRLIDDEQDEYISRRFSKSMVKQITHFQGDTLTSFIVIYKPSYADAKKLTDYDIRVYIKSSLKDFAAAGYPLSNPFVLEDAVADKSKD